jgi:adenylate kinase family enzyme
MRVAVVGSCASGKSTIARELQARGLDAYVVGQEHSTISWLWKRRSPDALVFLDVSLEAVRQRRGPNWPEWLFMAQRTRLDDARRNADVIVDTGLLTVPETVQRIVVALGSSEAGCS